MSTKRHARISELFVRASDLSAAEQSAFLDDACGEDAELRADVETLLARDSLAGRVLGSSALKGGLFPADSDKAASDGHPSSIGPYKIIRVLGEGGMGVVYLAEQEEPFRRRVALKLIKLGIETATVIRRFDSERQVLALMDHPNIARVYEAGATEQGRSYFAMEYVEGIPITEYCDRNRLETRERLELFLKVCVGVQHAHTKGIIHRDLKPPNVLVTTWDGQPVPKIIDFGIAKATAARLTERTAFTELGQLIGTPEYMSPEQAELSGLDVDTRTDVYSLGVMLYTLLVGALPVDSDELREQSFDEIRRRIREDEPPAPSTRLQLLNSSESAERRRTDPVGLTRLLRGELDWIVMKAMEKDRGRRYQSTSALAEEIDRYLRDEPVLAGPPSRAYRWGKFVRRHKVGVGFAVMLLVLLVSVSIAMTLQARRIVSERDRANQEAATSREVSGFLVDLFEVSDPGEARGGTITAREILGRGAEKIEEDLAGQPLVQARLMRTMGKVYLNLGLYSQALNLLERSVERSREVLGLAHPETLTSMNYLGVLYWNRGLYDKADALWVETLDNRRRFLGAEHPDTLKSMNNLGILHRARGQYEEAEKLYLETLEIRRRVLPGDHPDLLGSLNNLANLYSLRHKFDQAEPFYLEAIETRRRVLGDRHPDTLRTIHNLGTLYFRQDLYDKAGKLYFEALAGQREVLGNEHRDTLRSLESVANLHRVQGRTAEAESMHLETLEIRRRALGNEHPETLDSMRSLASLYVEQGDLAKAETIFLDVLEVRRRVAGETHPQTLTAMADLGSLYRSTGRYDAAERLIVETLEQRQRVLREDDPRTLESIVTLARIRALQGQRTEAIELLDRAVQLGWADEEMIEDPDLDSIRGDDAFQAIVVLIRSRNHDP